MEAVRKITEVKNNSILLKNLNLFNNKKVEVIVLPISDSIEEGSKTNTVNLRKFAGSIKKFGDGIEYQRQIRSE